MVNAQKFKQTMMTMVIELLDLLTLQFSITSLVQILPREQWLNGLYQQLDIQMKRLEELTLDISLEINIDENYCQFDIYIKYSI